MHLLRAQFSCEFKVAPRIYITAYDDTCSSLMECSIEDFFYAHERSLALMEQQTVFRKEEL